jgi:AcrR family transcriptional regulator
MKGEMVLSSQKKESIGTRNTILDVALKLFRKKGYEETTILDIVHEMRVSRGSFYHYFKTKGDVFAALLDRKFDEDILLKSIECSDLTGLEKIRKICSCWNEVEENQNDDALMRHIWLKLLKDPKFLAQHCLENRISGLGWLIPVLKEGMSDGSIRNQDPDVLAELVSLHLNMWLIPTIYPGNVNYAKQKLQISRKIFEFMGCPIIDDKLEQSFIRFIEQEAEWDKPG